MSDARKFAEQLIDFCYASPTAFHAVQRGQVGLGDHVVVQGCGPVGLMACALSRLAGAQHVTVIGAPELRLDVARRLGADDTIDIQTTSAQERCDAVLALTNGRGADVTI
ncbi:MAG TPA: zinc-binding dehydrogenase, partial [Candidatus Rifleibacterium sp.]|nr:zinc-binding dehydrogenase [Candidatus Rifleibacterium sp.]